AFCYPKLVPGAAGCHPHARCGARTGRQSAAKGTPGNGHPLLHPGALNPGPALGCRRLRPAYPPPTAPLGGRPPPRPCRNRTPTRRPRLTHRTALALASRPATRQQETICPTATTCSTATTGASGARDLEKIPPFVLRFPVALLNASPYAESSDPNHPAPVHRRTKCSPDHRRKPAGRHLRPVIAPAALYPGPAYLGKFCGRTGRLAAGKPPRIRRAADLPRGRRPRTARLQPRRPRRICADHGPYRRLSRFVPVCRLRRRLAG